jgi:Ohr subfamily peroxiredoxin
MELTKILYTAEATTTGGRDGHVRSSDGRLELDLAVPAEMGGSGGDGTNPEQLFAAGYAACFQSALYGVAAGRRDPKPDLSDSRLTARVGIGPTGHGGFGLAVTLDLRAPRVAREEAAELMARAHRLCPYSDATRGNVEVTLAFDGVPISMPGAVGRSPGASSS